MSAIWVLNIQKTGKFSILSINTEFMPTGATGQTTWQSVPPANLCQLLTLKMATIRPVMLHYFEIMTNENILIIFQYDPVMGLSAHFHGSPN